MTRSTQHKAHNVRRLRLEVEGNIQVTVIFPRVTESELADNIINEDARRY